MNVTIVNAAMIRDEEEGYKGSVLFEVEGHKTAYEVTLLSKNGSSWDYSLSFGGGSGPEEDIFAVERALEEDDELFDRLLEAAEDALG